MDVLIGMIMEQGILFVIAALFIWDKVTTAKSMAVILQELQASSRMQTDTLISVKSSVENTTTALNIIQNTLAANTQSLERHDIRAEYMNSDIKTMLTLIQTKEEGAKP